MGGTLIEESGTLSLCVGAVFSINYKPLRHVLHVELHGGNCGPKSPNMTDVFLFPEYDHSSHLQGSLFTNCFS